MLEKTASYPVSSSHDPDAIATDASKKGISTTVLTTVELTNSIILARPKPLRTLIY